MDYLLLKRVNQYSLSKSKSKNYIKDKKPFQEYNSLMERYKRDFKDFNERNIKRNNKLLNSFPSKIAVHLLSVSQEDTIIITLEDLKGKVSITDYNTPKKRKKDRYKNVVSIDIGKDIYLSLLHKNTCIIEQELHKYNLKKLLLCFDYLEPNGNFVFKIENYCTNESIDLIYLCLCLFEEIVLFDGFYICCRHFNPQIDRQTLNKLSTFTIQDKSQLNELEKYLVKSIKFNNHILNLIINLKLDELYNVYYIEYYKFISSSLNIVDQKCIDEMLIELNHFFVSQLKKSYNKNSGTLQKIKAGIGEVEGNYLRKVLKPKNIKKCMEIGLAMGISTLNILSVVYKHGGTLLSIDPNQSGKWKNMGKKLIINAGLGKYHKIIEDKSYNAMPKLLEKEANSYDFIFIDGWHTFDYTLLDFFYADKLLKVNGIIVVDDALHPGVNKTLKYIDTNYKDYYKKLESPKTFGAYKKIKEDPRDWDYHTNF